MIFIPPTKKKRRTKKHFKEFFFLNHFPPMMMVVVHSSDKKKKRRTKNIFRSSFFENHFPPMMMMVVESNKKPIFKRVFSEDCLSHFPTLSAKFIKKKVRFSTWNLIFFYSKFRKLGPYFIAFTLKRKGTKKKDKVFLF